MISLEISLPIAASASEERLSIPSHVFRRHQSHSGNSPVRAWTFLLSGGLFSDSADLPNGGGKWTVYGKGGEPMTFAWRRKVEDHHATLPLRMRGALTEFVGLGEDCNLADRQRQSGNHPRRGQGSADSISGQRDHQSGARRVGGGLGSEAGRVARHFPRTR